MKKRASLILTGAWYSDVELCERFQVQVMLNKIAEEFVRRTEVVCIRICLRTLLLIFRNLLGRSDRADGAKRCEQENPYSYFAPRSTL